MMKPGEAREGQRVKILVPYGEDVKPGDPGVIVRVFAQFRGAATDAVDVRPDGWEPPASFPVTTANLQLVEEEANG